MNQTNTSMSGFMRWAERRIAEEVERIERIEADQGTAVCFVEHNKLPYNLTDEQKLSYINAVDALRSRGVGSMKACKQVGIHVSTYSQWRKKFGLGRFGHDAA